MILWQCFGYSATLCHHLFGPSVTVGQNVPALFATRLGKKFMITGALGKSAFSKTFPFAKHCKEREGAGECSAACYRMPKELVTHHKELQNVLQNAQRVSKASYYHFKYIQNGPKGMQSIAQHSNEVQNTQSINKVSPTMVQFMCLVFTEEDEPQKILIEYKNPPCSCKHTFPSCSSESYYCIIKKRDCGGKE
jgi:hypothetical protein